MVYFPGCPNWQEAGIRLQAAMDDAGVTEAAVEFVVIDSDAAAVAARFAGSPTFLADGLDQFDGGDPAAGLTCRVYRTKSGRMAGLPDVSDLAAALRKKAGS